MGEFSEQQSYPPLKEARPKDDLPGEAGQRIAEMLAVNGIDSQLFKRLKKFALGLVLAGGMTLMAACGEKTVAPQVSAKTPVIEKGSLPSQGSEQELVITTTPSRVAEIIESTLVPTKQKPKEEAPVSPTSEATDSPIRTPTSIVVRSSGRDSDSRVTVSTVTSSKPTEVKVPYTPTATPLEESKNVANGTAPDKPDAEETPEVRQITVKPGSQSSSTEVKSAPVAPTQSQVDQTAETGSNFRDNIGESQWNKEWGVNETIPLREWWNDMVSQGYIKVDSIAWRFAGDQINSLIDDSDLVPNPDEFWKTGRGSIGNFYSELKKLESASQGHIEVSAEAYENIPGDRNCDLYVR